MFGPVGNFSIKFCARFENNYLKLLAMETEQKDKPSFSFRQIFVVGAFVLGTQGHLDAGLFWKKNIEKNTCAVMIRIIITFGNQIFL